MLHRVHHETKCVRELVIAHHRKVTLPIRGPELCIGVLFVYVTTVAVGEYLGGAENQEHGDGTESDTNAICRYHFKARYGMDERYATKLLSKICCLGSRPGRDWRLKPTTWK